MVIEIYDIEVFEKDWIVTFRNPEEEKHTVIHNNNYALKKHVLKSGKLFGGFNNKHYDNWILHAILNGASNEIVKKLNDWIISEGKNGWEFPFLRYKKRPFNAFDLRDDLPMNLSLKAIEGNLGLDIVETGVAFDIGRKLTDEELESTFEYCKTDVDNTVRLYELRKDYLESKKTVARLKGIPEEEALGLTNAKLASRYLDAKKVKRNDERNYKLPDNLNLDRIPKEVIEFFERMHDESISDDKLFKSRLKLPIDGVDYVYGFGGVHASQNNYFNHGDGKIILNWDVASLYPMLMIIYNYVSRNVPNPKIFADVVARRLKAKAEKDFTVSDALKLIINTAYGATLNKWNDLYDPLMAQSICISGQLFLTDLVFGLKEACPSFETINFNTDGIMFAIDFSELPKAYEIMEEWEDRTQLELEEDLIKAVYQKDVNNYIVERMDGKVITKGGYVSRYNTDRDFINNNMTIIDDAIVNYFLRNQSAKETIEQCDEPIKYQNIAKTGYTYSWTYHQVGNEKKVVQKVNRVFATKNNHYGTVYKVKENGREDKVASIPEHCIVSNQGMISIKDIDKEWYIELAEKRINDYKGAN